MRTKIWRKISEVLIDSLLIVVAFALAYLIRIGQFQSTDFPYYPFISLGVVITPVFIGLFALNGLYSFKYKSLFEKFHAISLSCLVGSMFFVLVFFY